MARPTRLPPVHLWPEIEREHVREGRCTHEELPVRLFCGKTAVKVTDGGPRCEQHDAG
jgi:hypothetical protein